jgi:hypothetical protein
VLSFFSTKSRKDASPAALFDSSYNDYSLLQVPAFREEKGTKKTGRTGKKDENCF